MLPMLRPRAQAAPTVETHAIARGYYERRTVDVAAATPLGSASRSVTTSTTPMTVHPKRARAIPIWVAVAGGTSGTIDRPGRGVDVHGLRSWHHGDAAGSVHWRSTAKRNELLVLERADDAGGGLAVLAGGLTPGEYAEDLIAQAAAVAVAAVREGRRTALFAASLPAYDTTVDRVAILDWFAKLPVDETPSMPLAAAAARTAGADGVVLWLSTDPPTTEIVHTVRRFGASLLPVARTAGR
jgi:uncharacterized protein (DUF58 family)